MNEITQLIQDKYGETARSGLSSDQSQIKSVAQAFGYSAEELASIPAEANMGLSCGNPLATAHIKPGETVVDLGSGGGLDVFLAARQVGPTGRAIGIDMTAEMLALARANAAQHGYTNVDFLEGTIDAIPLPDGCADLVISNCVLNLAPDKPAVFREIHRILKPGGRLAVSDIALKQALPDELAQSVVALIGCVAGAISFQEYEEGLKAAGFADVAVVDSGADLNAYALAAVDQADQGHAPNEGTGCCGPRPESPDFRTPSGAPGSQTLHAELAELMRSYDVNTYAASVKVFARR